MKYSLKFKQSKLVQISYKLFFIATLLLITQPAISFNLQNLSHIKSVDSLSQQQGLSLLESAQFLGSDKNSFLQAVKKHNLYPKESIYINNVKISFTDVFLIVDGRVAVITVIEKENDKVIRLFYRSNSQGIFRLLPAVTEDGWYSKGIGEASLDLCSTIQKFLSDSMIQNGVRNDIPELLHETVVPRFATPKDALEAAKNDPLLNLPRREFLNSTPNKIPSADDIHFIPEEISLISQNNYPDFINGRAWSYETITAIGGKVSAKVFRSIDKQYEYTFFEDNSGRVWIASVHDVSAPINLAGLRTLYIATLDLTMPRFEYYTLIPDGYTGSGKYGNHNEYRDAWPYLMKIKIIQDYYLQRGLVIPPIL